MKENKKSLWIARNKNGTLFLYNVKPILHNSGLAFDTKDEDDDKGIFREYLGSDYEEPDKYCNYVELSEDSFPDVTFENSPVELVPDSALKPVFENTDDSSDWKTAREADRISNEYQEKRIKEAIEEAVKHGRKQVSLSKIDDFTIYELNEDLKKDLQRLGYWVVPSWAGSSTITIKWH